MILVATQMTDEAREKLQAAAAGREIRYKKPEEVTPDDLKGVEILFGNVSPAIVSQAEDLKFIQLISAGFDPYLGEGKVPAGCTVCCSVGAYGLSVGEYAVTALMSLNRKLQYYVRNQEKHDWKREGKVKSIWGSTILVLGAGSIGGVAAKAFRAMGAYVIGTKRDVTVLPDYLDEVRTISELDELLPRADAVVIALPSNRNTYHLFTKERFALMKNDAYIINVGRGNIIDCMALNEALKDGVIGGACLDVTEPEPLPADHPLWERENVIITPHIAGGFWLDETHRRVVDIAAENIRRYFAGEKLINNILEK